LGACSADNQDILLDPTTRDVHDVRHVITAIASSSSIQKAKQFAQQVGAHDATLYDNYDGTSQKTSKLTSL